MSVKVRSSQRVFTEMEVSGLTGVCPDHLRNFAQRKHLGFLGKAAAAGEQAGRWLFSSSDLMVVVNLLSRCEH